MQEWVGAADFEFFVAFAISLAISFIMIIYPGKPVDIEKHIPIFTRRGETALNESIGSRMLDYVAGNPDSFLASIGEHVWLSLLALVLAMAIGIPLGYASIRSSRYEKVIGTLFQGLRIIPSLAVLILLIPWLGTGIEPALTALVLLAIPPILMNTAAGLHEVPGFMLETAHAMGMTPRQVLWRVQFPLALPLILTGVKTAMIEIIASATLASKIGAGGLGDIIFTGLGLNRVDLLLVGGLTVAALSITASLLLELADRWLLRYKYL